MYITSLESHYGEVAAGLSRGSEGALRICLTKDQRTSLLGQSELR